MASGALRRTVEAYVETWRAAGPAGRRFLAGALIYAVRLGGVSFALPLFLEARGYDRGAIGQIQAAAALSLLILGFPVVRLCGRDRHRLLLAFGPVFAALGLLLIVLSPPGALWPATIGGFLAGAGGATFWTLGDPLLATTTPAARRTHVFALKYLAFVIGFAIGGGLGGWLPALAGSTTDGGAAALGLTLVAMALLDAVQTAMFLTLPVFMVAPPAPLGQRSFSFGRVLPLVVPELGFAAGYGAIRVFLPLFLTDAQGLSTSQASTTQALAALAGGVGVFILPSLGARFGLLPVITVGRLAGAAVVVAWFAGFDPLAVAALVCLFWLVLDGTEVLYVAAGMERVVAAGRARFSATSAMVWSLGSTGATYLSGQLQDTSLGFAAAFSVGIAGYLLSALWTATVFPLLPRVGALADNEVVIDEAAAVAGGEPLVRVESG